MTDEIFFELKSDQELVRDALRNPDEFSAIINRYAAPLKRYIFRLGCYGSDDGDDILQEIFIKTYLNLNEYDHGLKFSSWIYRIAHNETISFFRKKNIRPSAVTSEAELALFDKIPDDFDFLKSLDNKISAERLRRALVDIDESYRNVIILRFFEEKNYPEISDILKIPEGTVATLLHRGKKHLRDILQK